MRARPGREGRPDRVSPRSQRKVTADDEPCGKVVAARRSTSCSRISSAVHVRVWANPARWGPRLVHDGYDRSALDTCAGGYGGRDVCGVETRTPAILHLLVRPALDDQARSGLVPEVAGGEPPTAVVMVEVRIIPVEVTTQGERRADADFPRLQPVAGPGQRHTDGTHTVAAPFGGVGEELRQGRFARAVEVDWRACSVRTYGAPPRGGRRVARRRRRPTGAIRRCLRAPQPPGREAGDDMTDGDVLGCEERRRRAKIDVVRENVSPAAAEGGSVLLSGTRRRWVV